MNDEHLAAYSLLHTYATLELLVETDIYTPPKQVDMRLVLKLEPHYSKLTATMAADRLTK